MICAEDEIGIGESHDGIMVLPDSVAAGTPAAQYFNVESDYCLEVELTPNRVDAASHYGVARDLKALFTRENFEKTGKEEIPAIALPSVETFAPDRNDGAVTISVDDTQGCPRYSGVTIRNVEVKESPEWLRNLLLAIGQRPINNIVDITNFILNGIGQPLHCFDLAKVKGERIVVRTCPEGTKFTTLDGVERTLDARDLMICNAEEPMCIAGVFGGLDSGVTMQTKDVFIESAYFNPTRVRRTARRHGLSTDASFRYERGTDPNITVYAAKLAACLIKELAGGEICGGIDDVYPSPVEDARMDFSLDYCKSLIGKEIPRQLVIAILKSLEIKVEEDSANTDILHLSVPTYRVDVTRPCDVVEEILRVYGYNNVEFGTEMHANLSQRGDTDLSYDMQQRVSDRLTGEGFMEILNNSLSAASYYENSEQLPISRCVKVMNPLSGDLSVMRQTLLFGGLESIAHNINRKAENLRFYEFGNVYHRDADKESTEEKPLAPFHESMELALWLTGDIILPSWNRKAVEASAFDMRGIIDNIFRVLGLPAAAVAYTQDSDEFFSARLNIASRSGKRIGELGILRHELLKRFDIDREVIYAAIDWDTLFKLVAKHQVTYAPLPKTQPVHRDLALLIDNGVTFAQIADTVRKAERKLLKDVTLFDVYEGKNLPAGKKSYGIAMTLQDDEKTLNDRQIDAVMQKIIKALEQTGAQLR
jgi:phenylalanine--tRNA ligase, beta subunit